MTRALRCSRRAVLASLPAAALAGGRAAAQQFKLRFGSGAEGGVFVVYADAFIDALKWANPSIVIEHVPTKGSSDNVPLLEEGKIDIGLVFGEVAYELFNRTDGPPTGLRVVCAVYSTPGMFVVRADSRYRTIGDLKGRPVVWNSRGSALALQGRYVVSGLNLDPDRDFEPIYTERLIDGPGYILEGRAAALWGGGDRWPAFVKIANDPRGARFITPNADEIDRIIAKHSFMRRFTVPAGRYRGQSEPLNTVGSWSYILARPFLDDAIGYWLAAAIHKLERRGSLFSASQLAETTLANTLAALPRPDSLQGGVELYCREAGLIR